MNEFIREPADGLVTLTSTQNEFEANMLAAVLNEAGIEVFVFSDMQSSLPLETKFLGVPVQVKRSDLERAQAALKQNVADSVDLDWDQVDVGEPLEDRPLPGEAGIPVVAAIGFWLAVLAVVIVVLGALVMLAATVW